MDFSALLQKMATGNGNRAGIETALIDPAKPLQNGVTESFNGRFRYECLALERFRTSWKPAS